MNMEFGLYQQQTMKLVMTNELRQAIAILQYSTQELLSFIEEQQLENPLLEIEKAVDEIQAGSSELQYDHYDEYKIYDGENLSPFDYLSKQETSLQDYLLNQVGFLHLTNIEKKIIKYIVHSLDENGYFLLPIEEAAKSLSVTEEKVHSCLEMIQSLDPVGVAARSLQECLLIQLKKQTTRNLLAEEIVEKYLDLLADRKWKEISKNLQLTLEQVQECADVIQTLQPKPGSHFSDEPCSYITPDAVIKLEDDHLQISMNDGLLPKITINSHYRELIERPADSESMKYMQQKYQQMVWLMRSIDQRQQTLFKVIEAIAKHQGNFFKYGYEYLKPLTLKEIAAEIDVHESTVSRATTQKYVQTPRGLFELKYFFNSAVKAEGGTTTSSVSVKEVIKKIVDQENKRKPFSDQQIVSILEKENSIEVSRRTVAKYREELNIPSSTKRKRFN